MNLKVLNMKPSRELDVLVAEKVFGAKVTHLNQQYGWRIDYKADKDPCNDAIIESGMLEGFKLRHFSTNLQDAWVIVKDIEQTSAANIFELKQDPEGLWKCTLSWTNEGESCSGEAQNCDTECQAICLAALNAVGIKVD